MIDIQNPVETGHFLPFSQAQRQLDSNVQVSHSPSEPAFDAADLKQRYSKERQTRLHPDGLRQYQSIGADLWHLLVDPFIEQELKRDPIKGETVSVLIVGGGFGAQLMAVELLKRHVTNFRIVEKASDFGGAWYWNRYPGIQCDIESYVYAPLLEETRFMPSRKYAGGRELFQHAQRIGRHYGLYERTLFQTEVKTMHWSDDMKQWQVHTNQDDQIHARFVISSVGPLHRPKLPGLPGLGSFKGHSFHTSRWDYDYTGGNPEMPGELVNLKDKRVGVIGTGATAIQIVPHLGRWASKLYVFQRTPSSVDVRGNADTDPVWAATQKPGWQISRMENFNGILDGAIVEKDLVADGWTTSARKLGIKAAMSNSPGMSAEAILERRQLFDFEKMEQIRRRVDSVVHDPQTAESLKPYYNYFCKRPCFNDEYLPTFNRPNVILVDTRGQGVSKITETGVFANGREFELDCLIFATGFEIGTSWNQRSGIEIFGRDGLSLREKWKDGPATLHGYSTRGFPNCFFMQNAQSALSPNYLHVTRYQAEHLGYIIKHCLDQDTRTVQPTQEAEDTWVKTILKRRESGRSFREQCTPGYYNNEGMESEAMSRKANYGGGSIEFMDLLDAWRDEGSMQGLECE